MGETISEQKILSRRIEQHLPLVKHVVFQVAVHFPRHVDREELARAGALGLVEAARRYDESRGVPFERFAAQRIRGAILDAARAADWAPRSVRNLARKLENTEQRLATELGIDAGAVEFDFEGVKAGFGVENHVNSLTYRELQQRRELIQKRMRSTRP